MVYTSEHPIIDVTVDVVCLTVRGDQFQVLLVERGRDPFKGRLAIPGGFLDVDEDLEPAARRELREETAVEVPRLRQLATYGRPDRDPRGRTISVAHLAFAAGYGEATAGDDAAAAGWYPVLSLAEAGEALAFDHAEILRDAVAAARDELERTPLATELCGDEFTLADLRRVYEAVWGRPLAAESFERQVAAAGFVEDTGRRVDVAGRPTAVYRRREGVARLHPPLQVAALVSGPA